MPYHETDATVMLRTRSGHERLSDDNLMIAAHAVECDLDSRLDAISRRERNGFSIAHHEWASLHKMETSLRTLHDMLRQRGIHVEG